MKKDLHEPIVQAAQAAQESLILTVLALHEGESSIPLLQEGTGLDMKVLRRAVLRLYKCDVLAKTGATRGVRYSFAVGGKLPHAAVVLGACLHRILTNCESGEIE